MAKALKFGFNLSDYDFGLPKNLIAQNPKNVRSNSKLLVYVRKTNQIYHKHFYDIPFYFGNNDLLILNDSKVIPAKLIGQKKDTGGKIEIVLVDEINTGKNFIEFSVLTKFTKLKIGQKIIFTKNLYATFTEQKDDYAILRFNVNKNTFYSKIKTYGKMPLPPYIKRKKEDIKDKNDQKRYQTIYAKKEGSIAAPTAGLHFTNTILNQIKNKKTKIQYITLHVGIGTFKPIKTANISNHKMMPEEYEISKDLAEELKNHAKKITSVGTTSTRTLENFAKTNKLNDKTDLYIYPGHKFFIDRLITNFHVPNSTPLMLVSAFIADGLRKNGEKNYIEKSINILKNIYKEAIKNKYRFYSYGDSMLII